MGSVVRQKYGPHRRPMADPRTGLSAASSSRWSRSTVARHARGRERRAVGAPHGSALARPARPVSAVPNMSSPLSALAADRRAPSVAAPACRGSARSRQTGSDRSLHRRQLQLGEKGGAAVGPTRRGKGSKIMAICDGHGLPLAVHVASASPGETTLVDATLAQRFLRALPTRLIGDRGYDSDPLDRHLSDHFGIELISPNRSNRRTRTQDGRPLRRYRRRWKIERLFAWFHNSRRLVTRWERHPDNFLGMIHLASAVILLRAFMR
jgi:transposase